MERLAASVRVQLTLNYLMLGGSVAGPGGVALSTAKYARPGGSPCPEELLQRSRRKPICKGLVLVESTYECFHIEDTIKT